MTCMTICTHCIYKHRAIYSPWGRPWGIPYAGQVRLGGKFKIGDVDLLVNYIVISAGQPITSQLYNNQCFFTIHVYHYINKHYSYIPSCCKSLPACLKDYWPHFSNFSFDHSQTYSISTPFANFVGHHLI
jgi:hypothetical protein